MKRIYKNKHFLDNHIYEFAKEFSKLTLLERIEHHSNRSVVFKTFDAKDKRYNQELNQLVSFITFYPERFLKIREDVNKILESSFKAQGGVEIMKTDTQLVPVIEVDFNGFLVQAVNARELHSFLEVGKDFSTWIKNRIKQYSFIEDIDYTLVHQNRGTSTGGTVLKEYHITLDMANKLGLPGAGSYSVGFDKDGSMLYVEGKEGQRFWSGSIVRFMRILIRALKTILILQELVLV